MKVSEFILKDYENEMSFPIDDLKLEPNYQEDFLIGQEIFIRKTLSSEGPMVSDYVNHEKGFLYYDYAIHISQEDRLTFYGGKPDNEITCYFIDCRKDSPTIGIKVIVKLKCSSKRKMVIPRGVGHTFDNVEFVVTRNELIWYTDENNPDWDINNDVIMFHRSKENVFPVVKVNRYLMPMQGQILFSRIQQECLQQAQAFSRRYKSDDEGYSYLKNEWTDELKLKELYKDPIEKLNIPGLYVEKNAYALRREHSYNIVPSTRSCISEVWEMNLIGKGTSFLFDKNQITLLTFMDRENTTLYFQFFDLLNLNESEVQNFEFVIDQRVRLVIPPNVAFKMSGEGTYFIRLEKMSPNGQEVAKKFNDFLILMQRI